MNEPNEVPENPAGLLPNNSENNYREFKHFPALDGLRGIAVLIVMFYHVGLLLPEMHHYVKGGFLGVDVFFVLSGFLITSILLKEYERSGSINLKNFYYRRFLRLIPAFWVFLLVLYLVGYLLLPGGRHDVIYENYNFFFAFTYLINWHVAANEGLQGNLTHIWSLAIEEQFYVIWSLVLYKAFGEGKTRKQIFYFTAGAVGLLIVTKAIRAFSGTPTNILYNSTDTRIDAILIGCLAAMLYSWKMLPDSFYKHRGFRYSVFTAFVLALAIIINFASSDASLYYGTLSVFALCIAMIVLRLITGEQSIAKTFLEWRPLRWIGQISYGLYLWHYLFFEFAKMTFESFPVQLLVGVVLAFIVSTLSFYLIEQPFLKIKLRLNEAEAKSAKPQPAAA